MTKRVLFLCTGNYYRSRFAEILFNHIAAHEGFAWAADSKGLALERGINNVGPLEITAQTTLMALGICPDEAWARFPSPVTREDLEKASLVIALKQEEHHPLLQERFPGWEERVEFWHIDDGPGILPRLEQEVRRLMERLTG